MNLWEVALIVLIMNIPFGYWRANVNKLSPQWFAAIHLPVPAVIALRLSSGIGWEIITFPVLVGAFFCGQYLGSQLHAWLRGRVVKLTSCLVMDISRQIAGLL